MSWEHDRRSLLVDAVCATVAYADVFDCALTASDVRAGLVYVAGTVEDAREATGQAVQARRLVSLGEYITLPNRSELALLRRQREKRAAALWSNAWRYGQILSALPFIRMVGVTGSLAANNPVADADIDFMLVSAPGRLWLARAGAVAIVRLASARGATICPNYLITTRALNLAERDLYTAHELCQLVPISGFNTYRELRARNQWVASFLPNRAGERRLFAPEPGIAQITQSLGEAVLSGRVGSWLDEWEGRRKIARFRRVGPAATFDQDVCEGHFRRHRDAVLRAFAERSARIGVDVTALRDAAATYSPPPSTEHYELAG
jgi:hypothetical protein